MGSYLSSLKETGQLNMKLVLILICLWGLCQGRRDNGELCERLSKADPTDTDHSTVSVKDLAKASSIIGLEKAKTCIGKFDTNGDSVWSKEECLDFLKYFNERADNGETNAVRIREERGDSTKC